MITARKNTGFCYMIAFFINVLSGCTFGAVSDNTKSFKKGVMVFDMNTKPTSLRHLMIFV